MTEKGETDAVKDGNKHPVSYSSIEFQAGGERNKKLEGTRKKVCFFSKSFFPLANFWELLSFSTFAAEGERDQLPPRNCY